MLARIQLWNALCTVAFAIRLPGRETTLLTAHVGAVRGRHSLQRSGLLVSTDVDTAEHEPQQLMETWVLAQSLLACLLAIGPWAVNSPYLPHMHTVRNRSPPSTVIVQ